MKGFFHQTQVKQLKNGNLSLRGQSNIKGSRMECHRTGNFILSKSNFKTMINNLFSILLLLTFWAILHTMGLFLQEQGSVFCKGKGSVVTFLGNRNTLMVRHMGL